jgi:hypothetical protein
MTNIISDFDQFSNESNLIDLDDVFSLNENGSAPKYSKAEFKNMFRGPLLESEGSVDEALLEKAHAYYEISMLYENKSHWLETPGQFVYLDADTHMILMKNGEGFVIEKSTFAVARGRSNNINEWGIGWSDIKAGWNKVKSVAKSAIKKTASVLKKGYDALSYGAQKAWEFLKTCGNVVVQFVKDMTWLDWAALAMSVISAILGILGAVALGSAAFSWLEPPLAVAAGVFQALGGGIHLYEGWVKIKNSKKILDKNQTITPLAKMASGVSQALPEVVIGGGMVALGLYDVVKAGTSIINPASGTESVAVGTSTKSALSGAAKTIAKPGGAIHHFIEAAGVATAKKFGVDLSKKAGEEVAKEALKKAGAGAIGKILTGVVALASSSILSSVLGWIWDFILKAGQGIVKGFDFLINMPAKITSFISSISKKANNTFTKIIAKGLDKLVKPMTSSAAKVIAKYIQPTVDGVKKWFDLQIKSFAEANTLLKEYKHELHTGISHHAVHKPSGKGSHNPLAPKHKIDPKNVTKKDVKLIKKAVNKSEGKVEKKKEKVKESQIWEMNYLKSFDNLEFI